jgi:hypothetical protein
MPSSFSSLGFPLEMDTSYQHRLLKVALTGEQLRFGDGSYVRWSPGAGIEIWLHVRHREVVGLAPHFVGSASMRIGITDRISRPEESPFAGAMRAWANPPGEEPDDGDYPFVFDLPDPNRFSGVELPRITSVQLAAFAHSFDHFRDSAAFDAAQQSSSGLKYAAESFIPSGTFVNEGQAPGAFAIFNGRIRRAERRFNPFSNAPFWWVQVTTLGGDVDVVVDPSILKEDPFIGGIAGGSFWLSGRLPNELADNGTSFWRRWMSP